LTLGLAAFLRPALLLVGLKPEFMEPHIHTPAAEGYAFGLEPEALVNGGVTAQFDLSARADDPVPGKTGGRVERPGHLAGSTRVAGCLGDRAVGGYVTVRHFADGSNDAFAHLNFRAALT
jgi:hypothetical protein